MFKTPNVKTQAVEVAATDLVPKVDVLAPETPEMGGTSDSFNHKKGRMQLNVNTEHKQREHLPQSRSSLFVFSMWI